MDIDRVFEIINDESVYIPYDVIPAIHSDSSYEYLKELVRDAYRDAKQNTLSEPRHRFDIMRYVQMDTENDEIDENRINCLYNHFGTSLTIGSPVDDIPSTHSWKYSTCPHDFTLYTFMCRFFTHRSRFALLICHNLSDVFVTEHMLPVQQIVDMLLANQT